MQNLNDLNRLFGREDNIQFIEGPSGMPLIQVATSRASAKVALYGGQMLSFKPATAEHDLFYLSQKAIYQQGKAIRGGAPLCWPWFGDDPGSLGRQAHGFARNLFWDVLDSQIHDNNVEITLGLESTATSKQWWPSEFRLRKKIHIGDTLSLSLTTENKGEIPFSISKALHSYFRVGDISQTRVCGLDGIDYLDKTLGFTKQKQAGDIQADKETDRVYLDAPQRVAIIDASLKRRIEIEHNGADNFVVWNPWDKAAALNDMSAEDYEQFICVETANALANSVIIAPGAAHHMHVSYSINSEA
ncbi:D-hexose-6-phosphate mutarotase [Methylophaga thiooxydans]|uniref:Putative glucose-6-phosphate 1-epimerase n=1 Tax=Methylophaga thiooxydans DMS010 TaxID=637616 RepID=C0N996_9GAMM|nr:D-hexose-6-phosphate mutarotase [Methylophaga thiooxydans]EEF78510.1 Aldose 1-epimerase subfamily [Methylophaga thiooxydans DMS010]